MHISANIQKSIQILCKYANKVQLNNCVYNNISAKNNSNVYTITYGLHTPKKCVYVYGNRKDVKNEVFQINKVSVKNSVEKTIRYFDEFPTKSLKNQQVIHHSLSPSPLSLN